MFYAQINTFHHVPNRSPRVRMARYGLEEQAVPREMHNQGSNQGQSYLCFPELRSRQRGKETSCRLLDARVVATLTRHQVRETGARPVPCSAALLVLPHTLAACSPTFLAFSALAFPFPLFWPQHFLGRASKQRDRGDGLGSSWQCPISSIIKIFQWKQRSAARSQQLSVPLPAMQRGSALQRTLASTPSTPVSDQRSGPKPYYQRVYACSFSARPAAHSSACADLVVC